MDKGYSQPLYRFEWVLCGLWSAAWMSIAWIAFTARHSMAVPAGFAALAAAAGGFWWLMRVNRYRRLLRFLLVTAWLAGVTIYVVMKA